METYWEEYNNLIKYSKYLERLCGSTYDISSCTRINQQIMHAIHELDQNNRAMRLTISHRQRRGAIDIIGNVANSLFGVLDSKYAEEMSKTIDDIQQREALLKSAIHNQTTLFDATVNVMKKDREAIREEFKRIEQYLENPMATTNYGKATTAFTYLTQETLLIISHIQRAQDAIMDVLVDTHHGRINMQLISPEQLEKEIYAIKGKLPVSVTLPVRDTDILKFYNIMTVEGRMLSKHAISKLKIPLIASEEFELLHLVPVPVRVNDTFMAVQSSFPALMVNLQREHYCPLTSQELNSCVAVESEKYLCRQRHPLYKRGATTAACEMDLLNNINPRSVCPLIKTGPGPHWIQLYSSNSWVYSLNESTTLNIVCDDQVTSTTLQGAGILTIQGNCVINHQHLIIHGHQVFPVIRRSSYIPSISLTEVVEQHQHTNAKRRYHPSQYNPSLDELDDIKQKLLNIKTQLPDGMVNHNIHHYVLGYVSVILIGIITLVALWRKYCRRPIIPATIQGDDQEADPVVESGAEQSDSRVIHIYDHRTD